MDKIIDMITESKLYKEDITNVINLNLPWELLKNKSILLSGATGLIGSFFIDVIMTLNQIKKLQCNIYAIGRNKERALKRFSQYSYTNFFHFIQHDINDNIDNINLNKVDYVIHLASNTHPIAYSEFPIETIKTNIIGTMNMLDFAYKHNAIRCLFASSNEIYGENKRDIEEFDESYCGYIDCNTLRAGYTESKRCGEALCQAYIKQKGMDITIARFTRSYGPTLLESDTKALSQFLKNALNKEDIILKSKGEQYYSFTYVADAVSGLLTILLCGKNGEAYNISNKASNITLKELAYLIANLSKVSVKFDLPSQSEILGFSKATKAILNNSKLLEIGWIPQYDIKKGISRTLNILQKNE